MKQWELRSITVPAPTRAPEGRRPASARDDRFPALLWATDVCLSVTRTGTSDAAGPDLPTLEDGADLFETFAPADHGGEVIDAHLAALRGAPTTFRLRGPHRTLRCLVVPEPDPASRTVGTICLALGVAASDDTIELISSVEARRSVRVA